MSVHRLASIPALALIAVSCASMRPDKASLPLFGMVYDRGNLPVSNALVLVDGKPQATTDANGRFGLGGFKYGTYDLEFRKEGYETLSTWVDYASVTQVLYVKMVSTDQLLGQAQAAITERRWAEALSLLDRAERTRPGAPATLYLKAVVLFRSGDAEGARDILEGLLKEEYREPAIYLLLADIHERRLADVAAAAVQLRAYLRLRYNPEVEKRLAQLEGGRGL